MELLSDNTKELPATAQCNNAFNHEFCRPGKEVTCVKEFVFEMVQSVGRQNQVNATFYKSTAEKTIAAAAEEIYRAEEAYRTNE